MTINMVSHGRYFVVAGEALVRHINAMFFWDAPMPQKMRAYTGERLGEYEPPERRPSTVAARLLFFDTLEMFGEECAREIIEDLRSAPLLACQRLAAWIENEERFSAHGGDPETKRDLISNLWMREISECVTNRGMSDGDAHYPELPAVYKALDTWSQRWNLIESVADRWCLRLALITLKKWTSSNQLPELDVELDLPTLPPKPPTNPIGLPDWNPLTTLREDYYWNVRWLIAQQFDENLVLQHLGESHRQSNIDWIVKQKVEMYCNNVKKYYRSHGWVSGQRRWRKKLPTHMTWTVYCHVLGTPYNVVAKEAGVHLSTVKRAVEDVEDLINLAKRNVPKGRRPGCKNSGTNEY